MSRTKSLNPKLFRKGKGNYRFRRFINGKDKEINTGTIDKKEAEKFLVEYLSGERLAEEQVRKKKNPAKIATLVMEAIDSDYEQLPLEDVFELWYIHSPNFSTTSKGHQQKRKVWFAKFVKFCFSQGITYFDEVNESIAIRFKSFLLKERYCPSNLNEYLAFLSNVHKKVDRLKPLPFRNPFVPEVVQPQKTLLELPRTFTRKEVMDHTGWTKTRLHIHLTELIEMELVSVVSKKDCLALLPSPQRLKKRAYNRDIQRILSSKSSVSKDLATKKKRVAELTTRLFKEQAEETKKSQREQKSLNDAYKKQITDLTSRLENQYNELTSEAVNVNIGNEDDANDEYDVFISHATEDKESFVNELHRILTEEYGLKVWYDAIEMKWGDSLRSRIDNGLRKSKFGIVVLSNHYISKGWTQYELDGLFQKEIGADKVILPIWHNITRDEILKYSPSLAGKYALNTAIHSSKDIGEALLKILTPPQ